MDTLSISTRRRMVKNALKKYQGGEYKYHVIKTDNELGFNNKKGNEYIIIQNDSSRNMSLLDNSFSRIESNWGYKTIVFYSQPLQILNGLLNLGQWSLSKISISFWKRGEKSAFHSEHEFIAVWSSFTQLFENHMIPFVSVMKTPRDFYEYMKHMGYFDTSYSAMIFIILTKIFEPEKLDTAMKIWEPMLEKQLANPEAKPLIERKMKLYMPIVEKVTREYIEEQNILSSEDYVKTGTSQQMRDHIFFIYKGRETQGEHPEDYYHRVNKEFPGYFSD